MARLGAEAAEAELSPHGAAERTEQADETTVTRTPPALVDMRLRVVRVPHARATTGTCRQHAARLSYTVCNHVSNNSNNGDNSNTACRPLS